MMKASQHTAEQIIKILEQAEKGDQTIGAVCRTNGIAENTFYRWRKTYGGMSVNCGSVPACKSSDPKGDGSAVSARCP
jgi:hypothetical protein